MMSKKIMGLGLLLAAASFSVSAKYEDSGTWREGSSYAGLSAAAQDTARAKNVAKNAKDTAKAATKNAGRVSALKANGSYDWAKVAAMVVHVKSKAKDGTLTEKWGLKNGKSSMALPANVQGAAQPTASALEKASAKWTKGQLDTFKGTVK